MIVRPPSIDLINMGVETFLLTSSINLILAQRLVRKICDKCKEPIEIKPEVLINLGVDAADISSGFPTFHGRGCTNCGGTGYRGRLAIYEVMVMHEAIKELIIKGASAMELKARSGKARHEHATHERLAESSRWIHHRRRNHSRDRYG